MTRANLPSDYLAVTDYLFALKARGAKFGIDRMTSLSSALGNPERAVPCVHVAGTNGKGSVAAMLDAIVHAAGWRSLVECELFRPRIALPIYSSQKPQKLPLMVANIR